jgi:hypothetical protein
MARSQSRTNERGNNVTAYTAIIGRFHYHRETFADCQQAIIETGEPFATIRRNSDGTEWFVNVPAKIVTRVAFASQIVNQANNSESV